MNENTTLNLNLVGKNSSELGTVLNDTVIDNKTETEIELVTKCGYQRRTDIMYVNNAEPIPIEIEMGAYINKDTNMLIFEECVKWLNVNVLYRDRDGKCHPCGVVEFLNRNEQCMYVVLRLFGMNNITAGFFDRFYDFVIKEHEMSMPGKGGMRRSIIIGRKEHMKDIREEMGAFTSW